MAFVPCVAIIRFIGLLFCAANFNAASQLPCVPSSPSSEQPSPSKEHFHSESDISQAMSMHQTQVQADWASRTVATPGGP
jgi:hypothetical protein